MAIGKLTEVSVTNSTEPVTLDEAKNYLRVDNDADNTKITSQISASRAIAESYLNRDILPRQRQQFILKDETLDGVIELYNAPINTGVDITVSVEGVANTAFEQLGPSDDPYIKMDDYGLEEILISYTTAGLQTNATVKQGVLAILADLYEYGEVKNRWIWTILNPLKRVSV